MTEIYMLNLQLFAETQVTTQESLSAEMKTFYDMTLLDEAQANLIHDQFGQKKPIPKNGGKTIEFRRFASLKKALKPLTEGVTPEGKGLSVSTVTATVEQYGDFIQQSDVLEMTSIDNTIVEATKALGRQAGATLDTVTRNVLHSGTSAMFASKWSGATEIPVTEREDLDNTSILKVDTVRQVVAALKARNAPKINGDYVAIIHPYVEYDLMSDKEWKDPHTYCDPSNLYEGEIGKISGVRFVESSEAIVFGPENGLLVNHASGYTGAITSVAFNGKFEDEEEGVKADELIGKAVRINGVTAKITDNDETSITFASTNFGDIADGAKIEILPCEAGAVFSTIFLGADAYGVTEVTGGGLETFVKQKGSGGTSDPLNQRSTVGWKATKTAEILNNRYLIRVESVSPRYSAVAESN